MHKLADIPGIGATTLELLEVAGFRDVGALARAGVDPLTDELIRANDILKIAKRAPTRKHVEKWIRAARELVGEEEGAPVEAAQSSMPVDFEAMPDVVELLEAAPCAIPFPGRWLEDSNIRVDEIIPGLLLNRFAGDLEVRVEDQDAQPAMARRSAGGTATSYVQMIEKPRASHASIDVSKLRSTEELAKESPRSSRHAPKASENAVKEDMPDLIRAPRPETNASRDVNSRRYIRGVLHSNPWSLRVGAVVTLLLFAIIVVSLLITPLLLLQDGDPEGYDWVRPWWAVFPFLVPVVGLCWLIWAYSCACRICRQKLFVPKKHRKNAKAHHLPLLGYILPLALHLLVFQWFRCTHCGTPVRLRK